MSARQLLRALLKPRYARQLAMQRRWRRAHPAESQAHSVTAAVAFANHMREVSAGYREFLAQHGINGAITAESWAELPLVTKVELRQNPSTWYGKDVRDGHITWKGTSGSTGEPFEFPHTDESQISESASNELNLLAIGWDPSMRRATIKAAPKQPDGLRGLLRSLNGQREIGFAATEFRLAQVPAMVDRLRQERISYLRGYSSTIFQFAQEVRHLGLSCPLRLVTTLGEGLNRQQADVVENAFGAHVYRDYGATEAMHVGFECSERRGYHVDLARFRVEILKGGAPAGPGEAGDLVITCFRNSAIPLVRYWIGDVARWASATAPCPCDNRFPLISNIEGRISEIFVTPRGAILSVPLISAKFSESGEHIVQFKMIQKEPLHFEILWVARHPRASEYVPDLHRKLVAAWGGELEFSWRQVEEIPADSSGKRRLLVLQK